jgi:threonine synthase
MTLYSTNDSRHTVSFAQALDRGIARDGGLYMPSAFSAFTPGEIAGMRGKPLQEIAFEVSRRFLEDEIAPYALRTIIGQSLTFPIPLRRLDERTQVLELFHGPTLAFKDVGARFMARMMAYLHRNEDREVTILVATSGDTGSAVAHGFHDVAGTRVVLLYPSAMVSTIQEQQMTTLGGNVTALEIGGTFDDCQRLVKQAFADPEILAGRALSSANSINIARLMPQMFYYFHAWAQLGVGTRPPVFSVPCGNLGNLTAGLFGHAMGLPARRFLAATNANNVLPEYLQTGEFRPRPSVRTISNAMDVGTPGNFVRMLALVRRSRTTMREIVRGASYSDDQTRETIREVYGSHGYLLDPHAAVAARAWRDEVDRGGEKGTGIILATAHPAKFADVYDDDLARRIVMPGTLKACMDLPKRSEKLSSRFDEFKSYLLHT